nr:phosphoenolpyruvate carboxykinase (ATP) [Thermanaeromonas sp.]
MQSVLKIFTVICAPGFKAEPEIDGTRSKAFIILNLEEKLILIGGSSYAGEIKKSELVAVGPRAA